jgi:hypothetical protein
MAGAFARAGTGVVPSMKLPTVSVEDDHNLRVPCIFTSKQPPVDIEAIRHIHHVFLAHEANPSLYLVRDSMLTLSPAGHLGAAWAEFALSGGTRDLKGDPLFEAIKAKQAKQQQAQQHSEEAERLRQRLAELPDVPDMLKWFGECALADCGCSRTVFPRVRPTFREVVVAHAVATLKASVTAQQSTYAPGRTHDTHEA